MNDTIAKVRALVDMKTALIEALRKDLVTAVRIIRTRESTIERLQKENQQLQQQWWLQQDEDEQWLADQLSKGSVVSGEVDVIDETLVDQKDE